MTSTDTEFSAGTVNDNERDRELHTFSLAGKKSGHGAVAWLPAPDYDMLPSPSWPPGPGRSPVIALLDSGVEEAHPWLPRPDPPDPSFVVQHWPDGEPPLPELGPANHLGQPDLGSHWIHGTFIAGLVHLHAPHAQIVSMRVMNAKGKVKQHDVVSALNWLHDNQQDCPVDIVLMAFGRPADPGDTDLGGLRKAMARLGQVQFVASAGNDHSDRTVYPAAFAEDEDLHVTSVGAGTRATERAPYSNYGPWVRKWRTGTNIISLAPLTTATLDEPPAMGRADDRPYTVAKTGYGYAWWSGTSFAAALYAAEVAKRMSPSAAVPPAGS